MSFKKIRIKSWEHFNEVVFEDSYNKEIERYRSDYLFRGLTSINYDLKTSLQRNCENTKSLEDKILRNFKKYCSLDIRNHDNIWEVISLGQHHQLPTRFLDWSYSPFVALHFATENIMSSDDGVVWCTKYTDAKNKMPQALSDYLFKDSINSYSIDTLYNKIKNLEELRQLEKVKGEFAIFMEPHSIDSRIVNQFAMFMFMSNSDSDIETWMKLNLETKKLIIPRELKLEFRDKLDQMNMNERIIYPGLDGVSKWIGRNYTSSKNMYPKIKLEYKKVRKRPFSDNQKKK